MVSEKDLGKEIYNFNTYNGITYKGIFVGIIGSDVTLCNSSSGVYYLNGEFILSPLELLFTKKRDLMFFIKKNYYDGGGDKLSMKFWKDKDSIQNMLRKIKEI